MRGTDLTRLRRRLRAIEAAGWLVVATTVRRLTMCRWRRLLGRPGPAPPPVPAIQPEGRDRDVAVALAAAHRRMPIATTCLDRAVAGRLMLRVRGDRPSLIVGLNTADPTDGSHAWLISGAGAVIVGGAVSEGFSAVTAFR